MQTLFKGEVLSFHSTSESPDEFFKNIVLGPHTSEIVTQLVSVCPKISYVSEAPLNSNV